MENFTAGVSKIHHVKEDLAHTIKESLYASSFAEEYPTSPFIAFDSLGSYQAILPFAGKPSMTSYCKKYLMPIEVYDIEKNGNLLNTLINFVKCNANLEETGSVMSQHKNTIRYRLKKIGEILNLNPFSLGDYEELALAVRIYICSNKEV